MVKALAAIIFEASYSHCFSHWRHLRCSAQGGRSQLAQVGHGLQAGLGHLGALLHEMLAEEAHMVLVVVEVARREHGRHHRHLGVELHAHQAVDHAPKRLAADALVLNFTDTSKMEWPVKGNVLLDYSMDQTIYFPTLDQYKCNPGLVIQSDVSTPVGAPANARILEVGSNEEIGNYVVMDLGNEYTATCGQLKEITAVPGEYLEAGQVFGYVAEPTKYYSVEGVNVFFELKHQEKAIDPLDQME